MMHMVDLRPGCGYPPLHDKSPEDLFALGLEIACTLRNVRVRVPLGDSGQECIILNGRILAQDGVAVF